MGVEVAGDLTERIAVSVGGGEAWQGERVRGAAAGSPAPLLGDPTQARPDRVSDDVAHGGEQVLVGLHEPRTFRGYLEEPGVRTMGRERPVPRHFLLRTGGAPSPLAAETV